MVAGVGGFGLLTGTMCATWVIVEKQWEFDPPIVVFGRVIGVFSACLAAGMWAGGGMWVWLNWLYRRQVRASGHEPAPVGKNEDEGYA
jgi:hypothetical protein